jgi:hypothetical protein
MTSVVACLLRIQYRQRSQPPVLQRCTSVPRAQHSALWPLRRSSTCMLCFLHVARPTRHTPLKANANPGQEAALDSLADRWVPRPNSIQLGVSPTAVRNMDRWHIVHRPAIERASHSSALNKPERPQTEEPSTDQTSMTCRAWQHYHHCRSVQQCMHRTMSRRIQRTCPLHILCRAWRHSHLCPLDRTSRTHTTRTPKS